MDCEWRFACCLIETDRGEGMEGGGDLEEWRGLGRGRGRGGLAWTPRMAFSGRVVEGGDGA